MSHVHKRKLTLFVCIFIRESALQKMIQDDPSNHKKAEYFPLNANSEEEICMKGIEISGNVTKEVNLKENDSGVYFKYALLIGLCNNLSIIFYI